MKNIVPIRSDRSHNWEARMKQKLMDNTIILIRVVAFVWLHALAACTSVYKLSYTLTHVCIVDRVSVAKQTIAC